MSATESGARPQLVSRVSRPWTMTEVKRREAYIPALRQYFPVPTPEEAIEHNINWLIQSCYRPDEDNDTGSRARPDSPEGPINWGDLGCVSVEPLGAGENARYLATVEEADPDAVDLQAFLEHWLLAWGWRVEVRTEW